MGSSCIKKLDETPPFMTDALVEQSKSTRSQGFSSLEPADIGGAFASLHSSIEGIHSMAAQKGNRSKKKLKNRAKTKKAVLKRRRVRARKAKGK